MAVAPPVARKRIAALMAVWYAIFLAAGVALKLSAARHGSQVWFFGNLTWAEVVTAPAMAVLAMFGTPWLAGKIEAWLKASEA